MVRPLVNEDRLQSLEELEIESLRPEFIEQVMSLRKKDSTCFTLLKCLRARIHDSQLKSSLALVIFFCLALQH